MINKIYNIQKSSLLILMIALVTSGFTAFPDEEWYMAKPGQDFEFHIKDNPLEERFDLEFISLSSRLLCISRGNWPANENDISEYSSLQVGSLHFRRDYVYILSEGQKNHIKQRNFGYYVQDKNNLLGGKIVIKPNAHLTGIIPYQEFEGEVNSSPNVHRELIFLAAATFCDVEWIDQWGKCRKDQSGKCLKVPIID